MGKFLLVLKDVTNKTECKGGDWLLLGHILLTTKPRIA